MGVEKWGPLLRSRLIDDAAIYKNMLDATLLQDPVKGVEYFKKTLRPYFVKGSTNVFLYRLLTFFNCRRGNQEFIQFISKFEVLLMRLRSAWMDTLPPSMMVRTDEDGDPHQGGGGTKTFLPPESSG